MDMRQYGENELSLIINNVEELYNHRFIINKEYLHELGILFTDEQYDVWRQDLEDEIREYEE